MRHRVEAAEGGGGGGGGQEYGFLPPVAAASSSNSPKPSPKQKTRGRGRGNTYNQTQRSLRTSYDLEDAKVSIKDLEALTEQSAKNQERWKSRVEGFAEKVYGGGGAKKKTVGTMGKRTSIVEDSRDRKKQEALAKHRGYGGEGKNGGANRRVSNVGEYDDKLRQSKFFGPYSVKEVMLVADIFSVLARGKSTKESQRQLVREVDEVNEGALAQAALQGKAPLHMFFDEPEIVARAHFQKAIHQLSNVSGHKDNGRVNLPTVFGALFPYMKRTELGEALEYVRERSERTHQNGRTCKSKRQDPSEASIFH